MEPLNDVILNIILNADTESLIVLYRIKQFNDVLNDQYTLQLLSQKYNLYNKNLTFYNVLNQMLLHTIFKVDIYKLYQLYKKQLYKQILEDQFVLDELYKKYNIEEDNENTFIDFIYNYLDQYLITKDGAYYIFDDIPTLEGKILYAFNQLNMGYHLLNNHILDCDVRIKYNVLCQYRDFLTVNGFKHFFDKIDIQLGDIKYPFRNPKNQKVYQQWLDQLKMAVIDYIMSKHGYYFYI